MQITFSKSLKYQRYHFFPAVEWHQKVTMISHTDPPVRDYTRLKAIQIQKVFVQAALDLRHIIVPDGIDFNPENTGFRIQCHDLHGPLPETVIQHSGDTLKDRDRIRIETCKLIAISGLRDHMRRWLRGGKFLLPTRLDGRAIVGFQVGTKTWIADGDNYVSAYHSLHEQVVG
jgi:hypothetical protein